jgi:hypothetical protein
MPKSYGPPQPTPRNAPCGTKALQVPPLRDGQKVYGMRESKKENSSRMTERRGNVYENKGPLGKTRGKSGNVIENKALSGLIR